MLKNFFDTFIQESLTLTKELEKIELSGNEIILLEYIERCTLRISCGKKIQFIFKLFMYHNLCIIQIITKAIVIIKIRSF